MNIELREVKTYSLALSLEGGQTLALDGSEPMVLELGRRGPQGAPGTSGAGYVHTQVTSLATWVIAHNLGYRPSVAVTSVGGIEVEAEVVHISSTLLEVRFATPYAGQARLS